MILMIQLDLPESQTARVEALLKRFTSEYRAMEELGRLVRLSVRASWRAEMEVAP